MIDEVFDEKYVSDKFFGEKSEKNEERLEKWKIFVEEKDGIGERIKNHLQKRIKSKKLKKILRDGVKIKKEIRWGSWKNLQEGSGKMYFPNVGNFENIPQGHKVEIKPSLPKKIFFGLSQSEIEDTKSRDDFKLAIFSRMTENFSVPEEKIIRGFGEGSKEKPFAWKTFNARTKGDDDGFEKISDESFGGQIIDYYRFSLVKDTNFKNKKITVVLDGKKTNKRYYLLEYFYNYSTFTKYSEEINEVISKILFKGKTPVEYLAKFLHLRHDVLPDLEVKGT